jgi:PAS domain S-box-containing protein
MRNDDRAQSSDLAALMVREIGDHAIFFVSLDGRIQTWNVGAERIFGFTADEIVGQRLHRTFTQRDVEAGVPDRELEKALADGKAEDERWHRRKDESSVYVSGSTMRISDDQGRPVGFAKVGRDFTGRKNNERRIAVQTDVMRVLSEERTLAAAAQRVVAVIGAGLVWDAGLLWAADARNETLDCRAAWTADAALAERYTELTRSRFRRGEGLVGNVWADDAPAWLSHIDDAVEQRERAVAHKAGFGSAVAFPIRGRGGAIGVVQFFSREARDRDRDFLAMSETLGTLIGYFIEREQDVSALGEANRAKDYLIARVSHDLRTPLTAIKGWAQMLRHGTGDEETYRSALASIDESIAAQESLINDLLDVSRVAFGKIRLERDAVDLAVMLDSIARAVTPEAERRQVMFRWHVERQPAAILADPQRIRQVINNLVSNALKFTPAGGEVVVTLTHDDRVVTIAVRDTGEGIAPDVLGRIFEPFRQAPGTAEEATGLGLGLAIVRELVELHGGSVRAESEGPGRGATFIVTLPMTGAMS